MCFSFEFKISFFFLFLKTGCSCKTIVGAGVRHMLEQKLWTANAICSSLPPPISLWTNKKFPGTDDDYDISHGGISLCSTSNIKDFSDDLMVQVEWLQKIDFLLMSCNYTKKLQKAVVAKIQVLCNKALHLQNMRKKIRPRLLPVWL